MPVESDADLLGMFDAEEFGVAATWFPSWARDWPRTMELDLLAGTAALSAAGTDIVMIRDDPAARVAAGYGLGATASRDEVMLPMPALPVEPRRGDLIDTAGAMARVGEARSDIDRRMWFLTLSAAEA